MVLQPHFFLRSNFLRTVDPSGCFYCVIVNITTMYILELTIPTIKLTDCRKFLMQNYCSEGLEYYVFMKSDRTIIKFHLREKYDMCKFAWLHFILEATI